MKVRAIRLGFYDGARRKPGEVFDLKDDKLFSKLWMEQLGVRKEADDGKPEPVAKRGPGRPRAETVGN